MYYKTILFLFILLTPLTCISGESINDASLQLSSKEKISKSCNSSQLAIIEKNKETNLLFKYGETLSIAVTDKCLARLKDKLDEKNSLEILNLYLDNVKMEGLPISLTHIDPEKKIIINFDLTRDSHVSKNKLAWDKLFNKQHDGYIMTLPVALSIGSVAAWEVQSSHPFKLHIVKTGKARVTLIGSLAMFFLVYSLLINNRSVLRDTKNGPYSLGKSQMAFWGLLLMLAFVIIWWLTGTMERIPEQTLALLGISGVTGLSSIAIRKNKTFPKNSEHHNALATLRAEQQALEKKTDFRTWRIFTRI